MDSIGVAEVVDWPVFLKDLVPSHACGGPEEGQRLADVIMERSPGRRWPGSGIRDPYARL
jgi:hypothetical protein